MEFQIGEKRVVFSGDMGRYNRPLLYDPQPIGAADTLICESTYGDRVHPPDALGALEETLVRAVARGGAVVIPAFAVERSQEILFSIGQLQRKNPALAHVPVFLDSPMAAQVDQLFERFPAAHKPIQFDTDGAPFGCRNLTVAVETEQSKAINHVQGPHIIVSASGMAAGGRVLHHLYNHIGDPRATVLFVGYQGAGSLGFFLTHGAQTIKIYGDTLPVHAAIGQISGYSAHADRNEIQQWFDTCTGKPQFYAVHGDPVSAQALCDLVRTKYELDRKRRRAGDDGYAVKAPASRAAPRLCSGSFHENLVCGTGNGKVRAGVDRCHQVRAGVDRVHQCHRGAIFVRPWTAQEPVEGTRPQACASFHNAFSLSSTRASRASRFLGSAVLL